MIWAARKGHLECVKYLLQMGADVDQEGAVSNYFFHLKLCLCCLQHKLTAVSIVKIKASELLTTTKKANFLPSV